MTNSILSTKVHERIAPWNCQSDEGMENMTKNKCHEDQISRQRRVSINGVKSQFIFVGHLRSY